MPNMREISDLVRTEFRGLEPRDVLRQGVAALLGAGDAASKALGKLGIHSVFDLATSDAFDHAEKLAAAGPTSRTALAQFGAPPADMVRADRIAGKKLDEIQLLGIDALLAVPLAEADAISKDLGVSSIREFSLYPPYRAAVSILTAVFFPENTADFDPEAPVDLIPVSGAYPTERVQYSTLLLDEVKLAEGDALTGITAPGFQPIGLDKLSQIDAGFKRAAFGALLTFNQSWYSIGVALGQLLHSAALAPGESTRIAVVDWSRKSRAGETEVIAETDDLSNDQSHNRAISEVTNAVADEAQGGFSHTNTQSQSKQSGQTGSIDISAPLGGLFGGPSGSAGFSNSSASTESSADSYSSSWGHRDIGSSMMQNVNDRTHQHAHSSRNRRASVVKEVSQSEHENVSTRVLTNYNHMHALTVQYYEVVQIFRVEVMLARADRVVFIPLRLLDFSIDDTVRQFRDVLANAALSPDIRSALRNMDVVEIDPDRGSNFPALAGNIDGFLRTQIATRATLAPTVATTAAVAAATTTAALGPQPAAVSPRLQVARLVPAIQQANALLWSVDQVTRVSNLFDRLILRQDSTAIYLPNDVSIEGGVASGDPSLKVEYFRRDGSSVPVVSTAAPQAVVDLSRIAIGGSNANNDVDSIVTLTLNRNGVRFPLDLPAVRVPKGATETRVVKFAPGGVNANLKQHLAANKLYYSQAVFRALDSTQIATLLSGFGITISGKTVPVSQVIDPKPVRIVGNYLAFRMNTDPGSDQEWQTWLTEHGIKIGDAKNDIVPLGSGGTFAEAVLGRFNCAEKLDITRFWNWKDSPIPIQPTEIAAIQTGSRQSSEDVKPGNFSNPIINITQPSSLPDPVGTAAILSAIQNGNMFRDMSGLQATVGLAQSALQASSAGAAAAAQQAGLAQQNQLQADTARQQIAADMIKDLAKTAASVFTGMPMGGGGSSGGPSASNHSQDGAKINYFDKTKTPAPASSGSSASGGGAAPVVDGGSSSGGGGTAAGSGVSGNALVDNPSGATGNGPWQYSQNPGILAANWGGAGTSGSDLMNAMFTQAGAALAEPMASGPSNGEVNLAGYFVWDPPLSDAEEIQALANGKWHPATVDFLAVMGSNTNAGMGDFPAILSEIVKWPAGSVKRVNFMTHSNANTLAIRGHNTLADVFFDVSVSDTDLDVLAGSGVSFKAGGKTFTLDDVRARFAPGAVFVVYGCKSGLNLSTLKALNKLLGIKVVSFKKEIVFCPPAQNGSTFVRNGMKIGVNKSGFACGTDSVTNWRDLVNSPDAVSVP